VFSFGWVLDGWVLFGGERLSVFGGLGEVCCSVAMVWVWVILFVGV